ncbi:MAG: HEAT repeat domain-containing protein [Planctomycetota bacterium]
MIRRLVLPLSALAVLALGAPSAGAGAIADAIDEAWAALDAARGEQWSTRRAALVELGPAAAARGLSTVPGAGRAARRTRAGIAREIGDAACIAPAVELLTDPDAEVRLDAVRLLGERRLERADTAVRIAALADAALGDESREVRAAAIESLAAVDDPAAIARLDALLDELAPRDRGFAAEQLADHAGARERLVRRVSRAFAGDGEGERALDKRSLAVLLDEYGDALAQLPGGGTGAAERRPLVVGRRHPSGMVRLAAGTALDNLLGRLAQMGELERAYDVLAGLMADGLDPLDAHYRRATLSLGSSPSSVEAGESAAAILTLARPRDDIEGREWRVRGALLAAAAEASGEDFPAARTYLGEAARALDGLTAERGELVPSAFRPAIGNVDHAVGLRLLRCSVDLWTALTWLAEGREPSDPELLALLRAMHVRQLRAQLLAVRGRSRVVADGFQVLLDDALGPLRLLLSNTESAVWTPARSHLLQLRLGEGLAGVSALEMPGFAPASPEPIFHDPLADPERRRLLEEIQAASLEAVEKDLLEEADRDEPDESKQHRLLRYRQFLYSEVQKMRDGSLDPLRRYRVASNSALDLSYDLRADGSSTEARLLSERMKLDLFAAAAQGGGSVPEVLIARLEVSVGSSWMDEGEPEKAERAFLQAEGRLAAYEEDLAERSGEGRGDPELRASYAAALLQARSLRADVLLSLAVNANVRMGDSEKALSYFERAFDLKRSDFMRVLLACYRARDGRFSEARQVLGEVAPNPALYYNLACTHALLGETELALDYLARELDENHASERSRDRQKEWAAGDPDLAPLRGHPRFERLVKVDG